MSRELDAKVAEKVMGWHVFRVGYESTDDETPEQRHYAKELERQELNLVGWYVWTGKQVELWGDGYTANYRFTENPSADYEVLKHVREKWDRDKLFEFSTQLIEIFKKRDNEKWCVLSCFYEPGDYSRAALKALGEEVD